VCAGEGQGHFGKVFHTRYKETPDHVDILDLSCQMLPLFKIQNMDFKNVYP